MENNLQLRIELLGTVEDLPVYKCTRPLLSVCLFVHPTKQVYIETTTISLNKVQNEKAYCKKA